MPLDFATLDALRSHHPAWRLLRSDHAVLVASFLHRVFVTPNVRGMPAAGASVASEVDRAAAIVRAVNEAAVEDVILLAGKGHETYQEIAGERLPFSDRAQAEQALAARTQAKESTT